METDPAIETLRERERMGWRLTLFSMPIVGGLFATAAIAATNGGALVGVVLAAMGLLFTGVMAGGTRLALHARRSAKLLRASHELPRARIVERT